MLHTTPTVTFAPMAVHIGKAIEDLLKERGMTKTAFADRIGRDRTGIYGLFDSESIDTRLLFKISKVLHHNFFKQLAEDFEPSTAVASEPAATYKKEPRAPIRMVFEIDPDDPLAAKQAEAIAKGVLARKKKK